MGDVGVVSSLSAILLRGREAASVRRGLLSDPNPPASIFHPNALKTLGTSDLKAALGQFNPVETEFGLVGRQAGACKTCFGQQFCKNMNLEAILKKEVQGCVWALRLAA
ncbi:hypothetical protein FB45DRAFT_866550 [Roridomyces roridus]|uniref:Uncharacterized protein n=1 Tax=Roridomyces roridus TaxID=1738132 RepID=A0AAD7BXL8_9AGAR|nr:hypothetical protein FB45DRAFT_866550 [Roridomyces roridus]